MDLTKIGGFIAELRKERGLTQEKLAECLGISNKTISRWENGNYLPPVEMLMELSKFFGVSINELLSGKRLVEDEAQSAAEENLKSVLSESSFSLEDRKRYFTKKWEREHWFSFVFPTIIAVTVIIVSAVFDQKLGIALGCLIPIPAKIIAYNQMMAYVEKNAFIEQKK